MRNDITHLFKDIVDNTVRCDWEWFDVRLCQTQYRIGELSVQKTWSTTTMLATPTDTTTYYDLWNHPIWSVTVIHKSITQNYNTVPFKHYKYKSIFIHWNAIHHSLSIVASAHCLNLDPLTIEICSQRFPSVPCAGLHTVQRNIGIHLQVFT